VAEPSASASTEVSAPADAVYELVSDLPGLGRLAKEFESGKWLRGADKAAVGVRFRGHNRHGKRRWSTTALVTDADPGRRFGFDVYSIGMRVSRWQYDIEPTGDGCRVEELAWDFRPGWFRLIANLVTGISDRAGENRRNMEHTLRQIKAAAEEAARR
jgi:hypothetical protein